MEQWFRFDEEIDENAIAIDLSDVVSNESAFYLVSKRIIDIVGSLCGIILLSPLFLIVAILIKLDDPKGKVFFAQERNGRYPKTFKMYKFRSMVHNAEELLKDLMDRNEQTGPVFKINDDPRITKVGKFIRKTSIDELPQLFKTSIDELPQLFNVLKGDMSLVGPRPAIPREVDQYNSYQMQRLAVKPGLTCIWQVSGRNNIGFDEWVEMDIEYIKPREVDQYNSYQMQRLAVKPGLTCIWQVSGRNNIGFDEWVEMDIEYIKTRNLWLDIKLIFKTVGVLFGDDNAS